jgi:hypothetical protein
LAATISVLTTCDAGRMGAITAGPRQRTAY